MDSIEAPIPADEQSGVGGTELVVNVASWFQSGASELASLLDRGIGVPISTLLERIREADEYNYEEGE